MSIDVGSILDSITEYGDNAKEGADNGIRLATIDPAYNGNGRPRVTFDGEQTMSTKTYGFLDYFPVPNDRVVMLPVGKSYVILGAIDQPPDIPVFTSTTRPSSPKIGQQIIESDTKFVRVWTGTSWDFVSAPVGWAEFKGPSPTTIPANVGQIIAWSSRNTVGDIGAGGSTINATRPGLYDVRGSLRFVQGSAAERFVGVQVLDPSGNETDVIAQNQSTGLNASNTASGFAYVPTAGYQFRMYAFSTVQHDISTGWMGNRLMARYIGPGT